MRLRPYYSPSTAHWRWNDDAGRVDGLEDARQVTLPRHFLNEHRRQSLGPELLVHAEEVDLGRVE